MASVAPTFPLTFLLTLPTLSLMLGISYLTRRSRNFSADTTHQTSLEASSPSCYCLIWPQILTSWLPTLMAKAMLLIGSMLIETSSYVSPSIGFVVKRGTWSKLKSEKSDDFRLQNFSVSTVIFVLGSAISSRVHSVCWSGLIPKALTCDLFLGMPPSAVETLFRLLRANVWVVKYSWLKSTN